MFIPYLEIIILFILYLSFLQIFIVYLPLEFILLYHSNCIYYILNIEQPHKIQSRNEFLLFLEFVIFRWFGIELDEPLGRHDGTVEEIRYFASADDHGVFVTDARLIKLHNQPPKPGK